MDPSVCKHVLAYTEAQAGQASIAPTAAPGLHVIRGLRLTPLERQFYEPALIVVVQGSKELMLGTSRLTYVAGQYLIVSVGLPLLASITGASPEQPYLALALNIDRAVIRDLMSELGSAPAPIPPPRSGLFLGTLDAAQAEPIARIAALLATPETLRVLYPSIAREFFYWLLMGPGGEELRRLAMPDSHTQRIADAIGTMRARFTDSLSIERLAAIAHMSPSSFHAHFKAVTSMSPLQYQKQLRLLEARRLMLSTGADATRAAFEVGYESTSQFSREYARMFGAPPRRDVTEHRVMV
jgi:AraC-like DNA-binding protein